MILPKTTKKQKYILYLLYKFRFLNTYHIQKLLNHKNPKGIQKWMKNLRTNAFVHIVDPPNTFKDNTKPFIYHLATKAKHILKNNEDCTLSVLTRIYKEKKRTEAFINHSLALADTYLFFLHQKEKNEELHFFTESEITEYDYFSF
ncbi:MAG: replication-relaxation family protein [Candidatus Levyibacteriota bacterium]